ncbi:hypothetical protein MGYG_08113 [Nannizzia gypsea CBS 118893]|uniref:Uncharacterized protein n=1 Tax=Arthroderma gypseum (strain ATCC MYA-4604 / CBS 118893) TaxID=535722 RepID=E4V530_ARTGP|nr:hypothetical protein MGYG_08113 [Nannizzia gypsea CBS 118893]EFR05104.1 hypothetical protein MGYG_08113 [Nannizzia gypsea CBS 118893]
MEWFTPRSISNDTEQTEIFISPPRLRFDPPPRLRLEFVGTGALVKAWPLRDPTCPTRCGGGKWVKLATIPELNFLGLDRFQQIEASTNKTEEDAFAEKLRLIGASWQADYIDYHTIDFEATENVSLYGWPSTGGLWVYQYDGYEPVKIRILNRLSGMLRLAITMDEQSQLLKDHGARFYEDPKQYPPFANLTTPKGRD